LQLTIIFNKHDHRLVTLADLVLGSTATVTTVRRQTASIGRLMELGLVNGAAVTIRQRAPLGGPLRIEVAQSALCLRVEDARCFEVDPKARER